MSLKKPKPVSRKSLDFHDCTKFIEEKYKINTRDYANSHMQFFKWCDEKGYHPTDAEGKPPSESRIWFSEHQAAIKSGAVIERPYQDFWHWLTDVCDIHRGATMELYEGIEAGAEPWQIQILNLYLKEFGRGPYLTDW